MSKKKPRAIRESSAFIGRYWLELQKNGDLIIIPRMHHFSNPGVPAGIEIKRFQPIEIRLGIHEDKVPPKKQLLHYWPDSKRVGVFPLMFCGHKYRIGSKSSATPDPKKVTCRNCLRVMQAKGLKR